MFTFFFFNDTATTEIYTLSLHDALPICCIHKVGFDYMNGALTFAGFFSGTDGMWLAGDYISDSTRRDNRDGVRPARSEEHTSELQSRQYLVCRLLLEKKTNANILIDKTS